MLNPHIAAAMARRENAGLKLVFIIPDRADLPFEVYAKDAAEKAAWLQRALERGWKLQS